MIETCQSSVCLRSRVSVFGASVRYDRRESSIPGGDAGGATPVPIPNTVVKPSRADGTALVTVWESRSLPGVITAGRRVCFPAFHLSAKEGRPESSPRHYSLQRGLTPLK